MLEILAESEGFSGRALRKLPFQVGSEESGEARRIRSGCADGLWSCASFWRR